MQNRVKKLAAATAAVLALGGLGAASSLGATTAKKMPTTTYKVGHACTKLGAAGKTAKGKKVVCTKVGKKLKWELKKKK